MLLFIPGLLAGITVHEFAHAWSASLLGDRLARRMGRVSLNPLRHLSPLGTLCMIVLPFGWGRPVQVNLYQFNKPRRDYFLTSLAGPAANLLMVGVGLGLMQFTRHSFAFGYAGAHALAILHVLLTFGVIANAVLAFFNLIPLPPLDGSKIWPVVLKKVRPTFSPGMYRLYWIVLIILMATHALNPAIRGVINAVGTVTPAPDSAIFMRHYRAAEDAMKAKRYPQAESDATAALGMFEASGRAHAQRARARQAQKNFAGAEEDIRRAMAITPGNPEYPAILDSILLESNMQSTTPAH